jgi:hypothetical protein
VQECQWTPRQQYLRPFERRQRLGVPAHSLQRDAKRKLRPRIAGVLRPGPAEKVDRLRQIAGAQALQPLLAQCRGRLRAVFRDAFRYQRLRCVNRHGFPAS